MPIKFVKLYTAELLSQNPDWWFVFGDNYEGKGRGGQAKVCRDQPNTIGWPTKKAPNNLPASFVHDADIAEWSAASACAIDQIEVKLGAGSVVVFPEDGIGTGLANLPQNAPKIMNEINQLIGNYVERYGVAK